MIACFLVLALCGIGSAGDFSKAGERTVLASAFAQEEAQGVGFGQDKFYLSPGQAKTEKTAIGTWNSPKAPYVEFSRDSSAHTGKNSYDLVLPSVQDSEQSETRRMSWMSRALEPCVEGTSEKAFTQQEQGSQATRAANSERQGLGGMAGISNASPMDTKHSSDQTCQQANRDSYGSTGAGGKCNSSATASSSSTLIKGGISDRGREEEADSFAWSQNNGCRTSYGAGGAADHSGGKREGGQQFKGLMTWTSQSYDENQDADRSSVQEDCSVRSGMVCLREKYDAESFPTCRSLPTMSGRDDGNLQSEARGAQEAQTRADIGFQKSCRSAVGRTARSASRFSGHTAGYDESALATAGSVVQVHELSDEDDEMVLAEDQEVEFIKAGKAVKPAFKAATSPQKVANLHLKHKKDKSEK